MKRNHIIYISLLFIVLISCEKEIKFNGKYQEPKLVLNTLLLKDSIIKVDISSSQFILDYPKPTSLIPGASVKLYKNGTFIEQLTETKEVYCSTHKVESNQNYSIKVAANGFDEITAQTRTPESIAFEIKDTTTVTELYDNQLLEFNIQFNLQNSSNKYWSLRCYEINTNPQDSNDYYKNSVNIKTKDLLIEDIYDFGIIFSGNLINPSEYIFTGSVPYMKSTSNLIFEIYAINKDMYDYLITVERSKNNNPMVEPDIVYSNVNNGMGIMAGGAISTTNIKLK